MQRDDRAPVLRSYRPPVPLVRRVRILTRTGSTSLADLVNRRAVRATECDRRDPVDSMRSPDRVSIGPHVREAPRPRLRTARALHSLGLSPSGMSDDLSPSHEETASGSGYDAEREKRLTPSSGVNLFADVERFGYLVGRPSSLGISTGLPTYSTIAPFPSLVMYGEPVYPWMPAVT